MLFNDGSNHVRYDVDPYSFSVLIDNARVKTFKHEDSNLVQYLESNPYASIEAISTALGIPKSTLGLRLQNLKEAGLIENKGTTRKNIWIIKK